MTPTYKIQDFYFAYYGRPADPSGLAFWVNGVTQTGDLIGSAIRHFGAPSTPEFSQLYPQGTPIETFLTQAYQNLFNRDPEAAGLKFWADGFRAWTTNGTYTEGEARAQILTAIVDAANGQSGTNDNLAITNKHKVADAVTASVKQWGTEKEYVSNQLDEARKLVYAVDHNQASINTALSKIQYGVIVEPGAPPIQPPVIVNPTTLPVGNNYWLDNGTSKAFVVIENASDSPFGYITIDTLNMPGDRGIGGFVAGRDKLDLSALGLKVDYAKDIVEFRSFPWTIADWVTDVGTEPLPYKHHVDFFNVSPIVASEYSPDTGGAHIQLLIDANGNGDLDPSKDVWISLIGLTKTTFQVSDLIV